MLTWFLSVGVVVAQVAGASDVCKAITLEVIDRMGPDVNVRACAVSDTTIALDGTWTAAKPDANARVGVASWFTVSGPGRVVRVQATVQVDAPHVRAVRTLPRGRQLAADDVRPEQGPVDGARFARVPAPATMTGARMMRVVDADAVVQALDVSLAPVVKAGESVVAVVRIGVVEVTATMTAVDNGGLGDQIRIAHRDRKRVLHATVVGPGRVEVTYER
jgi:flagellar basal body P-ring formation protein FlgA